MGEHTPGPWDYVPSTEHHGPYVTSAFGSTICDCYVMSEPSLWSSANGGKSKPIHHLHEMADPNARLIAESPNMLEVLKAIRDTVIQKEQPEQTRLNDIYDLALAAIAKAEARS